MSCEISQLDRLTWPPESVTEKQVRSNTSDNIRQVFQLCVNARLFKIMKEVFEHCIGRKREKEWLLTMCYMPLVGSLIIWCLQAWMIV